jgi:ABC-type sugar transport system ATPase subunit
VLVVSEELEELFEICDRIAVMAKGRLSAAVPTADTNVMEVGLQMTGLTMWSGSRHGEAPDHVVGKPSW